MWRIAIKHYARWTPAGAQLTHMSIHSNDSCQVSETEIKVTSSSTWLKLIWAKELLFPGGNIREIHFKKVHIYRVRERYKANKNIQVVRSCDELPVFSLNDKLFGVWLSSHLIDQLGSNVWSSHSSFQAADENRSLPVPPSLTARQRSLAAVFWLQNVGFKLWASLFNALWLNGPTTPGWKGNISMAEVLLKAPRMNLYAVWKNLSNQRLTMQIQYVMVSMDAR